MSDIPVWRAAIKDSEHPMHNIAWYLFSEKFNVERVARRFADRRDEILPFLYAILDDGELDEVEALGSGYAPINAVRLLGEWQVIEAIPRLFVYLEDAYYEFSMIYDQASIALEKMPAEAIDQILEFGKDGDRAADVVFALAKVGRGDDRAFDFIAKHFERIEHELDVKAAAKCLAINDVEKAESFLQKKAKDKRYRQYKRDFEEIISYAKSNPLDP